MIQELMIKHGYGREIVFDMEATGLDPDSKLIDVAAIELMNGQPTGDIFQTYINPQKPSHPEALNIHGLSEEFLADKPLFNEIAQELRGFIGDSPIVITCRTKDNGDVLDIVFTEKELRAAGQHGFNKDQWVNVRRWSEEMFGNGNATLNKVANRYNIPVHSRQDDLNHGALVDARLLAAVYPLLLKDYRKFTNPNAPDFLPGAQI